VKATGFETLVAAAALIAWAGCSEGSGEPKTPNQRGEIVYKNVCIACHNQDPSQPGALGPAIAGASSELIRHRVLYGTYPPGYQPKRGDSNQMPRFPHLEASIDDLAAYLVEAGS
jgi:mono/diheme cytochrome c family protein